jgi:hypothetical protein
VSLLERSNQRWKLYLFITLMGLGAILTLFQGLLYEPIGKDLTVKLAIAAMVLIAATLVWAFRSIACPACEQRLLAYAITKVGLGTWFVWLLEQEKCPKCGYTGRPSQGPAKPGKRKRR